MDVKELFNIWGWKILELVWRGIRAIDIRLPEVPTILPLKFVGVVNYAGHREKVRVALKHDLDWDRHYEKSHKYGAYWLSLIGRREYGRLQVMDIIIEWRFGAKGLAKNGE